MNVGTVCVSISVLTQLALMNVPAWMDLSSIVTDTNVKVTYWFIFKGKFHCENVVLFHDRRQRVS